jgi:hypothetical protein
MKRATCWKFALAAVAIALTATCLRSSDTPAPTVSPEAALTRLVEGNKRFVAGSTTHPDQTAERRTETAKGQHPFAIILTCADSRLSPEILFDEGIGDLFVVRNAGNLLDDHVLGSIEYAVEHLHATLIVVLGHTKCGAVSAAVAGSLRGRALPPATVVFGEMGLLGEIRPVSDVPLRLKESVSLGFAGAILPAGNAAEAAAFPDLQVTPVRSVEELLARL